MAGKTKKPILSSPASINPIQVKNLLKALTRPDKLEKNELARALSPVLVQLYPELKDRPAATAVSQGLERLWRETAGSFFISHATMRNLSAFLTLEVWYLYPASRGRLHRSSWRDDKLIGRPKSTEDVATRLTETDYLAMIMANGVSEQAQMIFAAHQTELEQVAPYSRTDKETISRTTLNSRRDVAVKELTEAIQLLFHREASLSAVAAEQVAGTAPAAAESARVPPPNSLAEQRPGVSLAEPIAESSPETAGAADLGRAEPGRCSDQACPGPASALPAEIVSIEPNVTESECVAADGPGLAVELPNAHRGSAGEPGDGAQTGLAPIAGREVTAGSKNGAVAAENLPAAARFGSAPIEVEALAVDLPAAPLVEIAHSSDTRELDATLPAVSALVGDRPDTPATLAAPTAALGIEPSGATNAISSSGASGALTPAALDQLAITAGGDDRWLWFQVRGLVQRTLALAETPPSARLVGRVLSAIALGLIPNLLTRRLSPEAVAWACSQCRLDHPLEQRAVAVGLRQIGLLRAAGPVVEFAHPMLADWFAAEYIAEYVPEKVLRLPGSPRLRRWAVENIIAAGDLQLAGRLSVGVLGSLAGRHPVCGLDAAALLAPLVRALPDQSLQRQWEQLAERLQPLGPVRSWRIQALLREYQVPVIAAVLLFDSDEDHLIARDELRAIREASDVDLLLTCLGLRRSELHVPEWHNDGRARPALVQELIGGRDWGRRLECAAWLQVAALDQPRAAGWRRWLPGGEVWALAELAHLARDQAAPAATRLLARSVLAADHHTLQLLNAGFPEMDPLLCSLMLATGLRCEWNKERERWEPLALSADRAWMGA